MIYLVTKNLVTWKVFNSEQLRFFNFQFFQILYKPDPTAACSQQQILISLSSFYRIIINVELNILVL